MSDRELLEMAAKAAGNGAHWHASDPFKLYSMRLPKGQGWNPLDDDGDALRLAVKLRMNLEITDRNAYACTHGNFSEPVKPDAMAATRRAIVRAAAEIGRSMP